MNVAKKNRFLIKRIENHNAYTDFLQQLNDYSSYNQHIFLVKDVYVYIYYNVCIYYLNTHVGDNYSLCSDHFLIHEICILYM